MYVLYTGFLPPTNILHMGGFGSWQLNKPWKRNNIFIFVCGLTMYKLHTTYFRVTQKRTPGSLERSMEMVDRTPVVQKDFN